MILFSPLCQFQQNFVSIFFVPTFQICIFCRVEIDVKTGLKMLVKLTTDKKYQAKLLTKNKIVSLFSLLNYLFKNQMLILNYRILSYSLTSLDLVGLITFRKFHVFVQQEFWVYLSENPRVPDGNSKSSLVVASVFAVVTSFWSVLKINLNGVWRAKIIKNKNYIFIKKKIYWGISVYQIYVM